MNIATTNQVEAIESQTAEGERTMNLEALRELSEVELAYVGGGQFIATFV